MTERINQDGRWRRVPIRETFLGLYDGPHATPPPSEDGPIFLGIGNLTEDGHLDLRDVRHIAEKDFDRWTKRVTPSPGDIVFTYEATLNRYAIIPNGFRGCLGRRLALIRSNPEVVDTRFLHYYLFGDDWRQTIAKNTLSGATVDRIPLTTFPTFELSLPPLNEQRRIASILSAYDDLIENNTRRIAILEEMARALYREWFVHFRFPGHEKVKMFESRIGSMPEGWSVGKLKHIVSIRSGYAFKSTTFVEAGRYGLVTIKNVHDGRFVSACQSRIDETSSNMPEYCLLKRGDILLSLTGNIGRTCVVYGENLLLNQRVAKLVPTQEKYRSYAYCSFREGDLRQRLEALATGVAQQNLSPVLTAEMDALIPAEGLVERFAELCDPLIEELLVLFEKNSNLRTTRDLLLPKLISGEIDVSAPDVAAEEATA